MNNLFSYISNYCERTAPGLLIEPLNLFSNAAFFLAAYNIQRLARKKNFTNSRMRKMILICYAIGIGSSLFHSFANVITIIADVVPIALFVVFALYVIMDDIFKFSSNACLVIASIFAAIAVSIYVFIKIPALNGSEMYLGPWIIILIFSLFAKSSKCRYSSQLVIAALFFTASLIFRILDQTFCPVWPYGTHFLWHILNGFTLLFVMRFYVLELAFESENKYIMHR